MEKNEAELRIKELSIEIFSEWIREKARQLGDNSSWTRQRKMPLDDILMCILAKKGLTTTIELRQYFQVIEKTESMVSKQAYLQQRQNLNPEVFTVLNQNYLRRFYSGEEAVSGTGIC
jgi:hypothetical protein